MGRGARGKRYNRLAISIVASCVTGLRATAAFSSNSDGPSPGTSAMGRIFSLIKLPPLPLADGY